MDASGKDHPEGNEESNRCDIIAEERDRRHQLIDLAEMFGLVTLQRAVPAGAGAFHFGGSRSTQPTLPSTSMHSMPSRWVPTQTFEERVAMSREALMQMRDPRRAFCIPAERHPIQNEVEKVKAMLQKMPVSVEALVALRKKNLHRELKVDVERSKAALIANPHLAIAPRKKKLPFHDTLTDVLAVLQREGFVVKSRHQRTGSGNEGPEGIAKDTLRTPGDLHGANLFGNLVTESLMDPQSFVGPRVISDKWRNDVEHSNPTPKRNALSTMGSFVKLDPKGYLLSKKNDTTSASPGGGVEEATSGGGGGMTEFNTNIALQVRKQQQGSSSLPPSDMHSFWQCGDKKKDPTRPTVQWLGKLGLPIENTRNVDPGTLTRIEMKQLKVQSAAEEAWCRKELRTLRSSTSTYYPPEKPTKIYRDDDPEPPDVMQKLLYNMDPKKQHDVGAHILAMKRRGLNPLKRDEKRSFLDRLGGRGQRFR